MKQLTSFASLCVAFLAVIGGCGYLAHDGHGIFAVAVLLLGCMAIPYLKDCIKTLFPK